MPPDWKNLRNRTVAAQVSFLDTELKTGLTFARVALKASDSGKLSRNLQNARKAYDTIIGYLANFPPQAPEVQNLRKNLRTLQEMIQSLEKLT